MYQEDCHGESGLNLIIFWIWIGIGVIWCLYAWARQLHKDLYNPFMAMAWPVIGIFWLAMSLDTYLHRRNGASS